MPAKLYSRTRVRLPPPPFDSPFSSPSASRKARSWRAIRQVECPERARRASRRTLSNGGPFDRENALSPSTSLGAGPSRRPQCTFRPVGPHWSILWRLCVANECGLDVRVPERLPGVAALAQDVVRRLQEHEIGCPFKDVRMEIRRRREEFVCGSHGSKRALWIWFAH